MAAIIRSQGKRANTALRPCTAPAFVMLTVHEADAAAQYIRELALFVETDIEGKSGVALIIRVTEMVSGLFAAPEAVTVIAPV